MTIEEFKSKIKLDTKDHNIPGLKTITGGLVLSVTATYTQKEAERYPEFLDNLKERLKERLVSHVYEDQRNLLYDEIDKLRRVHPTDFVRQQEIIDNLLRLAKHQ